VNKEESKDFFFEKKKQKTFVNLGHEWFHERGLKAKSFLLLFFKKEVLSSFL
jgi:hypothetical protein